MMLRTGGAMGVGYKKHKILNQIRLAMDNEVMQWGLGYKRYKTPN